MSHTGSVTISMQNSFNKMFLFPLHVLCLTYIHTTLWVMTDLEHLYVYTLQRSSPRFFFAHQLFISTLSRFDKILIID